MVSVLLNVSAGPTAYWQAGVFALVCVACVLPMLFTLLEHPALLKRRISFGAGAEHQTSQKLIVSFLLLLYAALYVVSGLDHRFSWSHVPVPVVLVGDLLVVGGLVLIFLVFQANPFAAATVTLGLRGARIHLAHEALPRTQLRAGAATGIDLSIMFPMIATLEEVRRLRAIYGSVREGLAREGVKLSSTTQVGIMVETPAAALMADVLAREVDFFSIGANDLFQYTMAADRTNTRVTAMFGALEPAVWRAIDRIVRAARSHGKLVAVCGELAADRRIGPLLAGLGVQELSMSPPSMLNVKAALHAHPIRYWQEKAQSLLQVETAGEAQAVLESVD